MQKGFFQLSRTSSIHAPVSHLPFGMLNLGATNPALPRHPERPPVGSLFHHLNHLGNDLSRALNQNGVADFHFQPRDLIHVMERRMTHRDPAHIYGIKVGHGGQCAGPPDLGPDPQNLCGRLPRGVLVSHGPAWRLRRRPEFLPQTGVIHFDHDAIDLIVQVFTPRFPLPDVAEDCLYGLAQFPVGVHLETDLGKHFEHLRVLRQGFNPLDLQVVEKHIELTFGDDAGIQLAHRACCRVARVCEPRFPSRLALRIDNLKRLAAH